MIWLAQDTRGTCKFRWDEARRDDEHTSERLETIEDCLFVSLMITQDLR
jgi:hypothetical protein